MTLTRTATLTAAHVMTARPAAVPARAPVERAIDVMRARGISSVLVFPPQGTTEYGVVTKRDVITRVVREGIDPGSIRVGEIMTRRVLTAEPHWTLRVVAEVMRDARVRRLPVVADEVIIGLVSDTDVFTALVSRHDWDHARRVRRARSYLRAARTGAARTVTDLMSSSVLTIDAAATMREAVEKMVAAGISSLLVAADGRGIITKRDVVTKAVAADVPLRDVRVGDVMSSPVHVVEPGMSIEECSAHMTELGVRRLPVASGGEIVGIISDGDILAAVASHRWWGHKRYPTSAIAADVMRAPAQDRPPVPAEAVRPELSLWDCAAQLARRGVRALPVVQEGRVIGVVTRADIVHALTERGGAD